MYQVSASDNHVHFFADRDFLPLIGRVFHSPLLVCTLERAERVALGMEARHYRVRPVGPVPRSWVGEACGLGLAAAALVWRR